MKDLITLYISLVAWKNYLTLDFSHTQFSPKKALSIATCKKPILNKEQGSAVLVHNKSVLVGSSGIRVNITYISELQQGKYIHAHNIYIHRDYHIWTGTISQL